MFIELHVMIILTYFVHIYLPVLVPDIDLTLRSGKTQTTEIPYRNVSSDSYRKHPQRLFP